MPLCSVGQTVASQRNRVLQRKEQISFSDQPHPDRLRGIRQMRVGRGKIMMELLRKRFEENRSRHPDLAWETVEKRLKDQPAALEILKRMEETGGEPDTIGFEEQTGALIFCDCSAESPSGRRSLCYDEEALRKRRKNPPSGSAVRQAEEIGVRLMDESLYQKLQERGSFDTKTSSWIEAPEAFRKSGGALFCERRYGRVFTFHNSADSYYASRGWRGYFCLPEKE